MEEDCDNVLDLPLVGRGDPHSSRFSGMNTREGRFRCLSAQILAHCCRRVRSFCDMGVYKAECPQAIESIIDWF